MSFDLTTITTEAVLRPPRMILLGTAKIGKSVFAASSDRPFFIPVKGEEGIDDIEVPKLPTPVASYNETIGWLSALYQQQHEYGTLVLDSSSTLEPMLWAQVCSDHNKSSIEEVLDGWGKGYSETLKYWRALTDWIDVLRRDRNMASIIIGHVGIKTIDDPIAGRYDSFVWDIHHKAASQLIKWSDLVLFCNNKVVVKREDAGFGKDVKRGEDITGERYLYTQSRPSHPGGGRGAFGNLPYELPLNWDSFISAVQKARRE